MSVIDSNESRRTSLLQGAIPFRIIDELVPGGIKYGADYLVEFEPDSLWYEASLTLSADPLRRGIRTEYHSYIHPPDEDRKALSKLGLNVQDLEKKDDLRILDTYDVMTGLADPETPEGMKAKGRVPYEIHKSFDIDHWSNRVVNIIREGVASDEKDWLHVDDNTSVLNHHTEEKKVLDTWIDTWRTRIIPYAKLRELAMFHSLMTGTASESFYKQFEALCDGIIDFRSGDEAGKIEHYARVRTIRGMSCDTRWRRLKLLDNGAVTVESPPKGKELGFSGWLRGPKKGT